MRECNQKRTVKRPPPRDAHERVHADACALAYTYAGMVGSRFVSVSKEK